MVLELLSVTTAEVRTDPSEKKADAAWRAAEAEPRHGLLQAPVPSADEVKDEDEDEEDAAEVRRILSRKRPPPRGGGRPSSSSLV